MRKYAFQSLIALLLAFIMTININIFPAPKAVKAATEYISVEIFVEYLAKELQLDPISGDEVSGYINALKDKGIMKTGDVKNYSNNLTRGDAMVFLNRADEYLYGDTLDADLVQTAIEKRITDIGQVKQSKREDVAKAYLKGYVKGYLNGEYSADRIMKVKSKMTKSGALSCIKMMKDKSLRAQISPDGQLIRTTNLPKYAKYYPYILASYPNAYYDWKFCYEGQSMYNPNTGVRTPYVNLKDYAAPVDIDKSTDFDNFPEVKKQYLNLWVTKAKTYLEKVFSADYRTINDDWVEVVLSTDYCYGLRNGEELSKNNIETYVKAMKQNKTIVEYSKIAIDGSSLYYFNGCYYLRSYVKYRIVSSNIKYGVDTDTLVTKWPYNNILFSTFIVDFTDFQIGEWREAHYDIRMTSYEQNAGDKIGVFEANLDEYFYTEGRTDK
ncbi:MAG TPA: hypothetical protein VN258_13730 [Mobilitalea sp.]|nr:hypothetical protein [Mobilitalea sp.]